MMPHWSEAYVGMPYAGLGRTDAGVDCWGLVYLVYAQVLGIALPSYVDGYADWQERAEISGLIGQAKHSSTWRMLDTGEPTRAYDLAVFRTGRLDTHIGVIVRPGLMLHITDQRPACIEPLEATPWRQRRSGVWRHVQMEASA